MMKRVLATLGTLAAVGGFALHANGATLGAIGGRAWLDSQTGCFSIGNYSSAVTNNCSSNASYLVPLQVPSNATTNYTFRATSTAANSTLGTAPACRYVVVNRSSSSFELGGNTAVWDNTSLGSDDVASTSTVHIDCVLPGTNEAIRHGLASVRLVAN